MIGEIPRVALLNRDEPQSTKRTGLSGEGRLLSGSAAQEGPLVPLEMATDSVQFRVLLACGFE